MSSFIPDERMEIPRRTENEMRLTPREYRGMQGPPIGMLHKEKSASPPRNRTCILRIPEQYQ